MHKGNISIIQENNILSVKRLKSQAGHSSEHLSLALSAFPVFPHPTEIPKKAQAVFPQWVSLTRRIKKHHIVSCIEMAFVTQH